VTVPAAPDPDELFVVVVHRNRPDSVTRTVDAYRQLDRPTRIVVVDNGPEEPTAAALADQVHPTEVIRADNLGFGPGANVGLRRWLRDGAGEWAVITPHDAVPDPGAIEMMLDEVAHRPDVGLFSADVGDGARPIIQPFLGTIEAPPTVESGFEESGYPHGTLMMVRRSFVEQVGLFDERYFSYCEEADLGLRAAAAGWRCGVVRGARVRNPGMSSSIELVAYLQTRNTLLMLREHFGRRQSAFRLAVVLIQIPLGVVHAPARGLHWSPRGRLLAVRDHLRGRYGPPPGDVRP